MLKLITAVVGVIVALWIGLSVGTKLSSSERHKASNPAPVDPHAGLRGACREFIQRRELETANAIWGDWTSWTVLPNDDGTFSVGARYAVGDRTRYTSCIVKREGESLRLVKLTRLQ